MSSIPIQDRIYRSRLTIKYRTNIDGVPVPQTLPLRLLVLGDFTGGKPATESAAASTPLTNDRLLRNRGIVSIRRGVQVDDIIGEMNVAFPIPPSDDPDLRSLRERAYVAGTFGGDDQTAAPLKASVDDIESDGSVSITGTIPFSARVHDNSPVPLGGPLEVAVGLTFAGAKVKKATSIDLKGRVNVPLAGSSTLDTVTLGAITASAETVEIELSAAKAKLWHDDDPSAATPWIDLDIKPGTKVSGPKPADGKEGEFSASGVVTVTKDGVDYPVTVTAKIPLAKDAQGAFSVAPAPAVQTYKVSGSLNIAVKATVTIDQLFSPPASADVVELPVQRKGAIRKNLSPAASFTVAVSNDDTTPKSASDPSGQPMPAYSVTGKLTGALEASVKNLLGDQTSVALQSDAPVKFDFPAYLTFKTSAGTTYLLSGKVAGAEGSVTLEIRSLYGRVWGPQIEPTSGIVPVRPEDIVVDVNAPGVAVNGSTVNLGDDGTIVARLDGHCDAYRGIRIKDLDSFTPDAIVLGVPEIRRLQIVRDLLTQFKSDVNLIPPVRDAAGQMLKRAGDNLHVLKAKLRDEYPSLDIGDAKAQSELLSDVSKSWFESFFPDRETALVKAASIKDLRKGSPLDVVGFSVPEGAPAGTPPQLDFHDYDTSTEHRVSDQDRLVAGLAALLVNDAELDAMTLPSQLGDRIDKVVDRIRVRVNKCVSHVLMNDDFRRIESNWRDVAALAGVVETDQTIIDLLDLGPTELLTDMKEHASDIFTSELFKRLYLEEYDRYGGKPFGAMIGLYHIDNHDHDIDALVTLSEIANAAHCPFVAGVHPQFFGDDVETWGDLDSVGDIEAHLNLPKFGKWNALRNSMEAPYIGLTLPGYLSRKPWGSEEKQIGNSVLHDETQGDVKSGYLWGNSAVLFAQNLVRSFEGSGWCQYIRGVKGGGLIQGMTVHTVQRHGKEETQSPVEFEIADYRELQFSKAGLIPLVHCKGSSDAAFFSSQSIKLPRDFRSQIDTQNAYLVTNLAYTFSITRIAHYVKRMMRDYIGATADAAYIQKVLQLWLNDYITTTVNPDDLTLRYYPFKAVSVSIAPKPGPLGWYKAVISILPHIQFEGMDVELRLEAALGGK